MVLNGPDGSRNERMAAVRPDDHPGALNDVLAALAVASNAGDATVVDDDLVDGESLANLGPRLGRSVNEQLVQHGPPGAIRDRGLTSPGRPRDREGAEVEGIHVDGRASGGHEPVEQAPPL